MLKHRMSQELSTFTKEVFSSVSLRLDGTYRRLRATHSITTIGRSMSLCLLVCSVRLHSHNVPFYTICTTPYPFYVHTTCIPVMFGSDTLWSGTPTLDLAISEMASIMSDYIATRLYIQQLNDVLIVCVWMPILV